MRRTLIVILILAAAGVAGWLMRPKKFRVLEEASIGEKRVTVWNRVAQVREPVALLKYGDRVSVLEKRSSIVQNITNVRIRTAQGVEGWVDSRQLMPADLLAREKALIEKTVSLPVQARGKTRVLSNVRIEAGRDAARIIQLPRDEELEVLSRATVERAASEESAAKESASGESAEPEAPKREDWLLVHGKAEDVGDIAGWIRASFLEPDVPDAIKAYAQGFRIVAWFELNRVKVTQENEPEQQSSQGMPQYLAAGATGGEGSPCDFTLIRFYTWSTKRRRYETAYVESNFCGKFPIRVKPIPPGANLDKTEATFSFEASTEKTPNELREYRMKQNIVRRIRAKR